MSEMLQHLLLHYKWGGKTLYYYNTADGAGEVDIKHYDVVQTDEGICESCTI
jgi:hypothetical protein